MNTQNEIAARVIGDIIARGMSLTNTDLAESVNSEAVTALDSIRLVLYNRELDEHGKMQAIEQVMKGYGIA